MTTHTQIPMPPQNGVYSDAMPLDYLSIEDHTIDTILPDLATWLEYRAERRQAANLSEVAAELRNVAFCLRLLAKEWGEACAERGAEKTADGQSELRELTNEEQDQILHLALVLLPSVDHRHRKKFHDHLVENSAQGVFLPSCSHRGWKGGGYRMAPAFLNRLWRVIVGPKLAAGSRE